MFRMSHHIEVGGMVLPLVTSVKINKDVRQLSDSATIVLPAMSHSRPLSFVKNIKKWQYVSIALGYDDNNAQEFEGYVKSVSIDDNLVTIECEDPLILFKRVDLPNKEMNNVSLKELMDYVLGEVNKFLHSEGIGRRLSLNCVYSYGYSKFTFKDATAYTFMEQIQKEGEPNIFISDGVLNIVPQYMNSVGFARYSMQKNICKEGMKLKWIDESDKQVYVIVSAKTKDNEDIVATAGKKGENKYNVKFSTIKDKESLQTIADNLYKGQSYTGYEGSFCGWLVPFCDANYTVELKDEAKELRSGRYYVLAVALEFSSAGGKRTLHIGACV